MLFTGGLVLSRNRLGGCKWGAVLVWNETPLTVCLTQPGPSQCTVILVSYKQVGLLWHKRSFFVAVAVAVGSPFPPLMRRQVR